MKNQYNTINRKNTISNKNVKIYLLIWSQILQLSATFLLSQWYQKPNTVCMSSTAEIITWAEQSVHLAKLTSISSVSMYLQGVSRNNHNLPFKISVKINWFWQFLIGKMLSKLHTYKIYKFYISHFIRD